MRRFVWLFVLVLLLAACAPASPTPTATVPPLATPQPTTAPEPTSASTPAAWWQDAVFYEVFVRSFYDSDGDGIGDLPGLIAKLDYLNDGDPATNDDPSSSSGHSLGVTGLWLMPIMASPSYHGYDVTDYYTVNPDYGTNDDFLQLMDEAHRRGIRVIIDLVLNHTSSEHPWFVDSASGPDAAHRNWYIWSDSNPGYLGPWGEQVWYPKNGAYYYAVFWSGMPDLNLENPDVTATLYDIARFWLADMGADGFRLDAIRHYVEEGKQQVNTTMTHDWLRAFSAYVQGVQPDLYTVGEAWDASALAAMYTEGQVNQVFEFSLATAILDGVNRGSTSPIVSAMRQIQDLYPVGGYATFLTNHDQDRVMNQLGRDVDEARVAAALLFTLPGTPFVYYGEEIGMSGTKPDELIRTPMQWTSGKQAGFTAGKPWEPVNGDSPQVNVEVEAADPGSLLNYYRALIGLRLAHPALRSGTFFQADSRNVGTYAFLRQAGDETILVVANLGRQATDSYDLSLDAGPLAPGDYPATDLLTGTDVAPLTVGAGGTFDGYEPLAELPARSVLILRLGALEP
jgi:alpha-amylase